MFFFPPWSMYNLVTTGDVRKKKNAGIFLIMWVTLQWFLFIFLGSNILMSFFYSNLSIALFFLVNLYIYLDMNEFSEEEKKLLNMMPLKILVTITAFVIMYTIPNILSKIYSHPKFINTVTWTSLHIVLSVILVISWFVFMFIDKYEVFLLFPKTEFKEGLYRLMPLTVERLASIYFIYIFLITLFLLYGYIF